jgi:hypothetical protein
MILSFREVCKSEYIIPLGPELDNYMILLKWVTVFTLLEQNWWDHRWRWQILCKCRLKCLEYNGGQEKHYEHSTLLAKSSYIIRIHIYYIISYHITSHISFKCTFGHYIINFFSKPICIVEYNVSDKILCIFLHAVRQVTTSRACTVSFPLNVIKEFCNDSSGCGCTNKSSTQLGSHWRQ